MPKAIINDHSIYYEEYGNGYPLLLIAGLASDSQSWLTVIVSLSKHFRVIIFDNIGTGRSDPDNYNITIQLMADDCIGLINHLKLPTVNILGHSMGGMIAMVIAIRYPDRVDKLILESTSPQTSNRNIYLFKDMVSYSKSDMDKQLWFKNLFYWIFTPAFFENNTMLNQAINMSINYPYQQSVTSFENQVKAISLFSCKSELYKIHSKTLVIFGDADLLFSSASTSELFIEIPQLQEVIVPNAAHSIHIENAVDFTSKIVFFLTDIK